MVNTHDNSDEVPQGDRSQTEESSLIGLLFETSPYGSLDAIVQHDHRTIYFYLNGDESFGTRACWVRNLVQGPYVINQDDLQSGTPPLLPRTHCRTSGPLPLPDPKDLHIVWFEEGNAAALFEKEQLIAVIPPWSGVDGFHGYALECVGESSIVWPLFQQESLLKRIHNAIQFWSQCGNESEHPFAQLQPKLLEAYNDRFGSEHTYYSLDGGNFPPRGAIAFDQTDELVILTVGMSFRPMPNVEMAVEQPAILRRIELGIRLPKKNSVGPIEPVLEQLSGLVAYPWIRQTWFGHGHTCQFDGFKDWFGSSFDTGQLITSQQLTVWKSLAMPEFRSDPIQLLWIVPTTSEDAQAFSRGELDVDDLIKMIQSP
ncbi:MAG: suppressor of fused domain protein [Planctomycetota bacterium]